MKPLRPANSLRSLRIIVIAAIVSFLIAACSTLNFKAEKLAAASMYPETSFTVFSDPHIFLPELGIGQPAFEKIKFDDRKVFEHSMSLLDTVIAKIIDAKPHFGLVAGDLSKDGEEAVHVPFAAAMEKFKAAGIPVFFIPGNHDVNNPEDRAQSSARINRSPRNMHAGSPPCCASTSERPW